MSTLDLVEAALAVIGVRPIVSKTVERFTKGKWNEMDALPRRITAAAKEVCDGTMSTKIPLGSINYNATLKDLTEPFDLQQLTEMVSKFPPELHELTSAFVMKAQSLRKSLLQIFPVATLQTLSGSRQLPPPDMLLRRFVSTLTVLDDPMRVFPLIAAGALLKTQVISMLHIYPSISKAITEALKEAITAEKARKMSYELPPRAEIGVASWLGNPQVGGDLHNTLQSGFQAGAQTPPKPGPSDATKSVVAQEALSSAQSASFPQARAEV